MRSNDIELMFRNKGSERATKEILYTLSEEIEDIKRTIKAMAESVVALTQVQTMLNTVADNMSDRLTQLQKPEDGMGSTRGLTE